MSERERVSLARCASEAGEEQVIRRTEEAIRALGDYGRGLRGARKVAIKINAGISRVVLTDGKQTELTEPAVVEGVIRAIRDVSDAEIVIGDAPTKGSTEELYAELGYPERLAKYAGVRLLDFGEGELVDVEMSHPGALFGRYTLHRELAEADAFVSIAKMKAHTGMGCTLCIKNLFGWTPPSVYGAPRHYLHDRLIRLPRVLVDLAAHMRPCLNVVDGIVAANNSEWRGTALRPGVILAGTNIASTDSVGMRVMGFDPRTDYPNNPFFYRRSAVKLANELGLGPIAPEEVEVIGPQPEEVAAHFEVHAYSGDTHRDDQIRRGAEIVHKYQERQDDLADRYGGRYLAFYNDELLWDAPDVPAIMRLEKESGRDWKTAPQFIVRCLPREDEIEDMRWYQLEADRLAVGVG